MSYANTESPERRARSTRASVPIQSVDFDMSKSLCLSELQIFRQLEALFDIHGNLRLVVVAAVKGQQAALAGEHRFEMDGALPNRLNIADRVARVIEFKLHA